jgi:hypothetical protein
LNGTLAVGDDKQEQFNKGDLGSFPNGVYKVTLGFYDELDEKILKLIFFVENVFHAKNFNAKDF